MLWRRPRKTLGMWRDSTTVAAPSLMGREGGVFVAEETQLVVEETQEDTGYVERLHHCSRTQSDGGGGERNHIWLTNTSVHTMADIVYDAKTTEVSYRLLHMKIRAIQITR